MNQALTLNPIPNTNLTAGQPWALSISVADPYVPPATLVWSLASAPAGAAIDPLAGVLTWRPAAAQANSTNLFTVQVADSETPSLSATQSFYVTVSPIAQPQLSAVAFTNSWPQLLVRGATGPDYVIQVSTNLSRASNWISVFTNRAPVPPFYWTDTAGSNSESRFYRVVLSP